MYETIEADIRDGRISSTEAKRIPKQAHVLITFLDASLARQGKVALRSMRGALRTYANPALVDEERTAWANSVGKKHAAS
jgi:hypothetical protein